jgi:hypothetical protein
VQQQSKSFKIEWEYKMRRDREGNTTIVTPF